MLKLLVTVVSVVAAVGTFTALWVGANLVFDQANRSFGRFSAIVGGFVGFVFFGVLHGNRLVTHAGGLEATRDALTFGSAREPVTFFADIVALLWWGAPGALIGAAVAYALSRQEDPKPRLMIGVGAGVVVGLIVAFIFKSAVTPGLRPVPLLAWTAAVGALGGLWSQLRSKRLLPTVATFLGIGVVLGGVGSADLGAGSLIESIIATVVPGALFGFALGSTSHPDSVRRTVIEQKSRAWIFMGPAVLFISSALVIPGIITLILSIRDDDGDRFVGLDNYSRVVRVGGEWNSDNFDLSHWTDFFGSRLLWFGLPLLLIGLLVAALDGRRTGRAADWTPQSGLVAAAGITFLVFGVFSVLRGTVFNNLWWVFTVTVFSTAIGLAVAAWSDGAKGERFAKSIIFMPMAISFVGASVIWRFMYRSQNIQKSQTGTLNAIWAWLGAKTSGAAPTRGDAPDYDPDAYGNLGIGIFDLEFFSFPAKWLFVGIFAALAILCVWRMLVAAQVHGLGGLVGWGVAALIPAYLAYRTASEGIGGYLVQDDGTVVPSPITFLETGPFNNFWLMVVLLWIESGFAMVILSAAIKAVPDDYIEAAKIDGANDSQVFWRIVIPQIAPTIGVVVTTIIVRVTKVYDIVKVMTGGNFDTDVLANRMIDESFQFQNWGVGAALAIILFLSVLPVMVLNIRRMQKEAAV